MIDIEELEQKFHAGLVKHITGTADYCQDSDICPLDFVKAVVSAMVYEMVRMSTIMRLDEDEFTEMCRVSYRSIMTFKNPLQ